LYKLSISIIGAVEFQRYLDEKVTGVRSGWWGPCGVHHVGVNTDPERVDTDHLRPAYSVRNTGICLMKTHVSKTESNCFSTRTPPYPQ